MKQQITDQYLIELLKKAYRREINCYLVFIKVQGIKPFAEIKSVSDEYRRYFEEKELDVFHQPTPLVYQKGQFFVCSDDLNALFMYREKKYRRVCCTCLNEPTGRYVSLA